MTQDYNVSVSMNQAAVVKTGLVMKQGDFGFNLKITVLDFDTSNTTPQIVFRKPMGAVESTTLTKAGNVYTYVMKGTELDTPGKVICDLKLKNSTTQRISSASFCFECVADTLDGLAERANSYSDTIEQIVGGFEGELDDIRSDTSGVEFGLQDATKNYFNPVESEMTGLAFIGNYLTNILTDSKSYVAIRIITEKNDSTKTTIVSRDITEPGEYKFSFTCQTTVKKIILKHNGTTRDLSISWPVNFASDKVMNLIVTFETVNPSSIGGFKINSLRFDDAEYNLSRYTLENYYHLLIPGNAYPEIIKSGDNTLINITCNTNNSFTFTGSTSKTITVEQVLLDIPDYASHSNGVLTITLTAQSCIWYNFEKNKFVRSNYSLQNVPDRNCILLLLNWYGNIYGDWMEKNAYMTAASAASSIKENLTWDISDNIKSLFRTHVTHSGNGTYGPSNTRNAMTIVQHFNNAVTITIAEGIKAAYQRFDGYQIGTDHYISGSQWFTGKMTIPAGYYWCIIVANTDESYTDETTQNGLSFSTIFSANDTEYLTRDESYYYYTGEKINVNKHGFNADTFMTISYPSSSTLNDSDCIGDYIISAINPDGLRIYSLSTKELLHEISVDVNHANVLQISNQFYDNSDNIPLIYCGWNGSVNVIRIDNQWNATVVKKIVFDEQYGYMTSAVFDFNRDTAYVFGYGLNDHTSHSGENYVILTVANIGNLTDEGEGNYSPEVVSRKNIPWFGTMQGAKYFDNKIIFATAGTSSPHNPKIIGLNTDGNIVTEISNLPSSLQGELETLFFAEYKGKINMFVATFYTYTRIMLE